MESTAPKPGWADITLEEPTPDGKVGLLALATDANVETNVRKLLPQSVGMYTTRLSHTNPITVETLLATAGTITAAANELLTGHDLDVLVYGCTAGAATIGHEKVAGLLRAAKPTAECVSPVSAATAAMRHLGISRPSILTPNIEEINDAVARYFRGAGFDVRNVEGFGVREDLDITRVPPKVLVPAAKEVCAAESDGLFISCTSLRSTDVIEEIEAVLGRPVVTSNQAIAWEVTRKLGIRLPDAGLGRLARS